MTQPWNMWNPAGMTPTGYYPSQSHHVSPVIPDMKYSQYSQHSQPVEKPRSKTKNKKPEIPGLPPPPTPPKKPVTAFFAYFMKVRETLKKQHPDKPVTHLSLIASKMWKAATPEERKITEMEYLVNMEKYKVLRSEYESSEEYKNWLALKQKLEREVHERALQQAKEASQARPSPPQQMAPQQVQLPQPPMAHQHPPPQMMPRHPSMQQTQMMPNFYPYYQMAQHGFPMPHHNQQSQVPTNQQQQQQQPQMNELVNCLGEQRGGGQMGGERQMDRKQLHFEVGDVMGDRTYKVGNLGWRIEPLMQGATNNSSPNNMPGTQGPHG